VHPEGAGFYNVYFISCLPRGTKISFEVRVCAPFTSR